MVSGVGRDKLAAALQLLLDTAGFWESVGDAMTPRSTAPQGYSYLEGFNMDEELFGEIGVMRDSEGAFHFFFDTNGDNAWDRRVEWDTF